MPQFLLMTADEAEALVRATVDPGGDWLMPVLIEGGPNAGMYALPPECAVDKAFAGLGMEKMATRAIALASGWPTDKLAERADRKDPWETIAAPLVEAKRSKRALGADGEL